MRWGKPMTERGWQPWFAWYPAPMHTGEWVWLEWVERAAWFGSRNESVRSTLYSQRGGRTGFTYIYRFPEPQP